jgi:hypothetical protein
MMGKDKTNITPNEFNQSSSLMSDDDLERFRKGLKSFK